MEGDSRGDDGVNHELSDVDVPREGWFGSALASSGFERASLKGTHADEKEKGMGLKGKRGGRGMDVTCIGTGRKWLDVSASRAAWRTRGVRGGAVRCGQQARDRHEGERQTKAHVPRGQSLLPPVPPIHGVGQAQSSSRSGCTEG